MKKVEIISLSADGTVLDFQTEINAFLQTLRDEHEVDLEFLIGDLIRPSCAIIYEPKKIEDSLLTLLSYFVRDAREQSLITGSQETDLLGLIRTKFQKT